MAALWVSTPDEETFLDLVRAPHGLNQAMINVLTDFMDYNEVHFMRGRYSLWMLSSNIEKLREATSLPSGVFGSDDGEDEASGNDGEHEDETVTAKDREDDRAAVEMFRNVFARAEESLRAARENFDKNMANGVVSFLNIQLLLTPGARVVMKDDGVVWGGLLHSIDLHQEFTARWYTVRIEILHALKGVLAVGKRTIFVESFKGQMALADLPFCVVGGDDAVMADLGARGRRVMEFHAPGTMARYAGDLVQESYWHSRRYRAHGRIVVDPVHFESMDPNAWNRSMGSNGIEMEDEEGRRGRNVRRRTKAPQPSDADAWRMWPYLYGFSLATKHWGRLFVDSMSPMVWREDAFDRMVMPERDKRVVHALVAHHGSGFQDIIDDKGGGLIFLLAGPPGEGKTLLAETVSEALKRPLYSVSVGQLGTEPGELEEALRGILDLATAWNAVILLDEADIFLEQRDSTSILRNAMVGVFLRLLEYHQGVLFLTTNRARNIDQAFYSRISVAIEYPPSDDAKRRQIWTNLLRAAGEDVDLVVHVAGHAMNGRQIKNCIRLGQTLARAAGATRMDRAHLLEAIDFSTRFSAARTAA